MGLDDEVLDVETDEVEKESKKEKEEEKENVNLSSISDAAMYLADRLKYISEVTSSPTKSRKKGYCCGSNIAVVESSIKRIIEGKATVDEALSLFSNVTSIVEGYLHTKEAFKQAEKIMDELKKKALKKLGEDKND